MAKVSGVGTTKIYIEGSDLSGDVNSLSGLGSSQALLDVTTLGSAGGVERLGGLTDGTVSVAAFFDAATGQGHDTWVSNSGKMPTADQNCLVALGDTVGDPCLMTVAKEATYYVDRPTGGAVSCSVDMSAANGTSPDMGILLTAGAETKSAAHNFTVVDNGASTSGGARGMVQVVARTSGTINLVIEDSPDNVTYTSLISFTSLGAVGSESKAATGTVNRYLRFAVTGTFAGMTVIAGVIRL